MGDFSKEGEDKNVGGRGKGVDSSGFTSLGPGLVWALPAEFSETRG